MKVLVIHNRYQIRAGEDNVFEQEVELLRRYNHEVMTWEPDNKDIFLNSSIDYLKLGLNTVWSQSSYQNTVKLLKAFKPDIVHVHNIIPLLSPSIFYACRHQQIPVVQTIHNYRLGCPAATFFREGKVCERCLQYSLLESIRYHCYRNSRLQTLTLAAMLQVHRWLKTWDKIVDGYIAVSHFLKQKLIEIGMPNDKIYVKPNFINSPQFLPLQQFGSYYLYIGRLVEEKGIRLLLQGYQLSHSQFPLVIIGSGDLEDLVKQETEQNSMIRYLGQQSKAKVLEWMQKAIALIFPSLWYECLPMTILEAYSYSLPVIGGNIGSVADIIKSGKTGILFDPITPHQLAKNIQQVESDIPAWIQIKQNLSQYIDPTYFSELNYQYLISIYEQVMTKNKI